MSASKERKQELELERKRQQEESAKAERKSMLLYTVVGAICAVAVVALLVVNSGILQRSVPALTVNGTEYSAADLQYYYNLEYQNEATTSQTYAMYGMDYGFDYAADPKDQIYDEESGKTWEEHFQEMAKQSATYMTAVTDAAKEAGHTLSEEAQAARENVLKSVDAAWVGTYNSRDAFLRANYGSYMTYGRFVELLDMELLASDYVNAMVAEMQYSEAEYDAYYAENADALDTFTVTQFVLQAKAPAVEEGEEELTEEEKAAALEQDKAAKKAVAEEIQAKLTAGADPEALAEEYKEELLSSSVSANRLGTSVGASAYGEWAVDAARKAGDTTIAEYDSGTAYNYYVVRYEGRALDTGKTADIRHMLIAAETDEGASAPTEAQYAAAKEKAEALLAAWQSGEATEEAFAALAMENSADSGSAANGGLMTAVSSTSGYVEEFTNWCLDPSRQSGDTGIVQNTGSSVKGWHIMYYVADNKPVWKQTADNALRSADYAAWEAETIEGYEAVEGFGMKFV